jgi:hypothetical protein
MVDKLKASDWDVEFFTSDSGYFAKVLIAISVCPICGSYMTESGWSKGIAKMSRVSSGEPGSRRHVCEKCAEAGKATFTCALCEQSYSSDQIQESFGCNYSSEDFLCKNCYKTRTAEVWDAKYDKLSEKHRYDYE